jgi:hypothetical protein
MLKNPTFQSGLILGTFGLLAMLVGLLIDTGWLADLGLTFTGCGIGYLIVSSVLAQATKPPK